MSDKIYITAMIICVSACTFWTPWWILPIIVFALTLFYHGSAAKTVLIAGGIPAFIWAGIASYRDFMAAEKASVLIGRIMADVSPLIVILLTGLIIGIVCGLSAISAKLVAAYFPERFHQKLN